MSAETLLLAALAGLGLALSTGPLGALIVWRRMAYFGDAVAHASLLGVAISLAFSISLMVGVLSVGLLTGLLAAALTGRRRAMDTALGVLAHSALAIGLLTISLVPDAPEDLEGFLFGEISRIVPAQVAIIWVGSAIVAAVLAWRWRALITSTVSEEIAASVGINPRHERLFLVLATAGVVAIALKIVGALLIGALLIIPSAAARPFARTPEGMVLVALVLSAIAIGLGLGISAGAGLPAGPAIVASAAGLFALSLLRRH